jgi:hypothetical protein
VGNDSAQIESVALHPEGALDVATAHPRPSVADDAAPKEQRDDRTTKEE